MFLTIVVLFQCVGHNINCILSWIENHSVLIGVIGAVVSGSLIFNKYLKQKRAEAFFGFYARLRLQLNNLHRWLNEKDWLEVDDPSKGNIYTLMYGADIKDKECSGFHEPDADYINTLKILVSKIKETLTETESNVYPKSSCKVEWYNNLQILYDFCEFIEQDGLYGKISEAKFNNKGQVEYKHIVKCKALRGAISKIKEAINEGIKY